MIPSDAISISDIEKLLWKNTDPGALDVVGVIDLRGHLAHWARAKYAIYNLMGGNLRVEKRISSAFSSKEIEEMKNSLIHKSSMRKKEYLLALSFFSELSDEEIIKNTIATEKNILGKKFNAGMKISRLLLQLIPSIGDARDSFQKEYSKFVEQFSKERTLVISIHPADYFMMSENTTGWRSCQSLDGQYRTATLAYLLDKATMVAYILTDSGKKCWRQLVYVSPDSCYLVQSRQYPSANTLYNREASAFLKESFDWVDAKRQRIDVEYLVREDIVIDKDACELWYNDITKEAFNTATVVFNSHKETFSDFISQMLHQPVRVGVNGMKCICGCGEFLNNAESLFSELHFENSVNEDEDEWGEDDDN
jgi:hypothetical protein